MTTAPTVEMLRHVHENPGAFPELEPVKRVLVDMLGMQGISQMQVPAHELIAAAVAAAAAVLQMGPHDYVRGRLAKAGIVPMTDGTYSHSQQASAPASSAETSVPMPDYAPGWVRVRAYTTDRHGNAGATLHWWTDQTLFPALEVEVEGRVYRIVSVRHRVDPVDRTRALLKCIVRMREVGA